jgi:outer membrane protein OmpA-like peptidoglycan-associated protein/Tol biopolymer transport system component
MQMPFIHYLTQRLIFLLLAIVLLATQTSAQTKVLADAERYYSIRNYEQAYTLFAQAIKEGANDPMVHYKAGVCLQKNMNLSDQVKAIPYWEFALANSKALPAITYFELGDLYLKNENFEKAIASYTSYKDLVKADKRAQILADKAITTVHIAQTFMSVPRDFTVHSMGGNVNSAFTEYNPVVSADESVLAFTALRPNTSKTRSGDKFIEEVLVSSNQSGTWSLPQPVTIASDYNVGTAGISPDGQKMLIFMGGATDLGNLLQITKSGNTWSKPTLISNTINSTALETTASITPDGKTIYFASDRKGGKGGLDIYKTTLQSNGAWSAPVNLGASVNTDANEDAPFIHPDQHTLFFTSDGHNTMGGRDIFKSTLVNNAWSNPENMGYPVNTTANDNYFTLLADGTRAYFSSDRKGGLGAQDIYYIDMPKESANIPLTMIKGKILDAETGKPIPTKMYLIDNDTDRKLDFVYHPDPETGAYLVILPPAKNYDMVIESEGFLPYTLNINVPNQTYFYELFQQINLKTIKQFDVVVGQEVIVKNAFYDTNQDAKTDIRKTHESKLVQSGTVDVYDMMLDLISSTDKEGIDYLVDLIQLNNSVDAINFDEKTNSKLEVASRTYYYDESDESKFEKKEVDGQTILALPTFMVADEARKQKDQPKVVAFADKAVLAKIVKIYFDAGKSEIKTQYTTQLDALMADLNKNAQLGIEISGFASAEGSEELNRELSNTRAIQVLEYFNHKGIVRRRVVAKGYGASKDAAAAKEEGRRVEVRLVDLVQ